MHPLQSGILRCKHPSERRPNLPPESPFIFWPRYVWHTLLTHIKLAGTIMRLVLMAMVITRSSRGQAYTDQALTPVRDDDNETLDLLTKTSGSRAAVAHLKKIAVLTGTRGVA